MCEIVSVQTSKRQRNITKENEKTEAQIGDGQTNTHHCALTFFDGCIIRRQAPTHTSTSCPINKHGFERKRKKKKKKVIKRKETGSRPLVDCPKIGHLEGFQSCLLVAHQTRPHIPADVLVDIVWDPVVPIDGGVHRQKSTKVRTCDD